MKISKYDILDGITAGFGMSGAIALLLGGGFCLGALTATGIIKAGEFFSSGSTRGYQSMMFYGSAGASAGLFLIGLGAATSQLRDKEAAADQEMEEIAAAYTAAVEAKTKPQDKQRTWAEWEEYEENKRFCRGCQYYRGGGICALHEEVRGGCGDHSDLPSCSNCKYYSSEDDLLPCAVHPLGLKQNCPDWEATTED